MKSTLLLWIALLSPGWAADTSLASVNRNAHDPEACLLKEARDAFCLPFDGTWQQNMQALETKFGLGSQKSDVVNTLRKIASAHKYCELVLSFEAVNRDLHVVPFVIHYDRVGETVVWRCTFGFSFDQHEKLVDITYGVESMPRQEASAQNDGK